MSFSPKDFAHLHVHSEFSLLDGASRVEDIVRAVKRLGMDAVAITDHGNMYAAVKFFMAAKKEGIHPVIGCEAYLAPRTRFDKSTKEDRSPFHITLLAKNTDGYLNLIKLVTASNFEGFYQKPRIDLELLKKHSNGLVVLSGCIAGLIPRLIMEEKYDEAGSKAAEFKEVLGADFYLEMMDNGIPEQKTINRELLKISKKLDIKVAATNDSHYTERKDAKAQDVLLCIQTGRFIDEEDRMRFGGEEFYLKSALEMHELFKECPEALTNTKEIAEKCRLEIETGKLHLPEYEVPEGYTSFSYLKQLAKEGLIKRYGSKPSKEAIDRLEYELGVIEKVGYAPFFLIVSDFTNYAKQQGIEVGPGRGSAAGSIVSYSIGITEVEPLKYGLIFERFLNPDRVTMPDIDVDFCFERRQEIIEYVSKKYGQSNVAQIITFGTMAARAAIRDVGRVQRVPLAEVDRIAKLIPQGPDASIDKAMKEVKELKGMYEADPSVKNLIDTAKTLEGLTRHASVHAAGVVISNKPLTEYVPLSLMNETQTVTQYPMEDLEKIGLLKMDFLGLRNLTMIAHATKLVKSTKGIELDVLGLPLDDRSTYDLLCRGETIGIFQLESHGMRRLIKELRPEKFEEVIALLALYRPGPLESGMVEDFTKRKHGKVPVKYELPELEPVLSETYGVILYQEQVMRIASSVAGFTLGEADVLRWAMGKKKTALMAKQRQKFIEGAVKLGTPQKKAEELFALVEKFAGYGFNKSHSTSYAVISYQTAYLKANYPVEFMAALLTSVTGVTDKVVFYVSECRRMGIKVLPPDVNQSAKDFTVEGQAIRFGLAAIKNVGIGAIESIVAARQTGGPFSSLSDLCRRVDLRQANKKVLESLIKAGAMDCFKLRRSALLSGLSSVTLRAQKEGAGQSRQSALFDLKLSVGGSENLCEEEPEFSPPQLLRMEKDVLGFYLSDHPLHHIGDALTKRAAIPIAEALEKGEGAVVRLGGIMVGSKKITTKKKDLMLVAVLEDLTGAMRVVVFPRTYEKYSNLLGEDTPVILSGRLDFKDDEPQLICESAELLDSPAASRFLHIRLDERVKVENLKRIKDLLSINGGSDKAFFHMNGSVVSAGDRFAFNITPDLVDRIERINGKDSAWISFDKEK
ncbi:MAG: DNA polymerase III subunit alpha [Candidatus Margulisiibacteriota bacterium]